MKGRELGAPEAERWREEGDQGAENWTRRKEGGPEAAIWKKGDVQGAEKIGEKGRRAFHCGDMTPHPPLLHVNGRLGWKGAETKSKKKTEINRIRRDMTPHPPHLFLKKRGQGRREVERETAGLRRTYTQKCQVIGTIGKTVGRERCLSLNRKVKGEGIDPPLTILSHLCHIHQSPMGAKEKERMRGEEKKTEKVPRRGRGI